MNRTHRFQVRDKIIRLARSMNTGSPSSLGHRLDLSPRTIKRIIREIRESGIDIRYDRNRESYVIAED
jgi:biotin operon repressor